MELQGVLDLFPTPEKLGTAEISQFVFSHERNPLYNLRAMRDTGGLTYMEDGRYVRLHVDGELVMSDTRMEKNTNSEFVHAAHGRVLIAGLGLGLILKNILMKDSVKEIIIIEKCQDVIDLVGSKFRDPRIKIIHADIFNYQPSKDQKFNVIYFDIWSQITQDNLEEIKKLHNRFKYNLDRTDPDCWMNSWMKEYLQSERRKERRSYQYF